MSRRDLNSRGDNSSEGDELDGFPGSDEGGSSDLEGDSKERAGMENDESGSDVDRDDETKDEVGEDEEKSSDDEYESEQEENMGSIRSSVGKEIAGAEGLESSITDSDSVTEGFENHSEDSGDTEESSSNSSNEALARLDERATLRQMMAESQRSVIATISAATKADIAKGKAIKQQRSTFDALLNTRIRLQKSLIAVNSFSPPTDGKSNPTSEPSIQAAETAALKLWNQLDTLRQSLREDSSASKKHPFEATLTTPTSALWSHMQTHETQTTPHRRAILSKWSIKLQLPAQLRPNLSSISSSTQTPLPALLDQHLSTQNSTRLMARSRIPRSCAPSSLPTSPSSSSLSPKIYDDSDFYTLLLRDLVDQRMGDNNTNNNPSNTTSLPPLHSFATNTDLKPPKRHRPNVDTKASKGRKMRYTVHEKLRDFMVRDDRSTWGEKQVTELFGGLLGVRNAERDVLMEDEDEENEERREEEGLMLFRSGKK